MAKYIDSEKLITEINKLRSESCIGEVDDGYEFAKSEICDLIDSLQQEQPEVDFEKAYKSYMESRKDDLSGSAVTVNMKDLARHFFELGRTRKEE